MKSAWGGEEKLHLLLAELLQTSSPLIKEGGLRLPEEKIETFVWSNCAPLVQGFQKKNFSVFRAFFAKDITSISRILYSPFSLLFLLLQFPFVVFWAKKNDVKSVLMLSLIEKVFLTPLFQICGIQVVWAHHAPVGKWLSKNPFFFLWKFWAKKVHIVVPSEFLKKEISEKILSPTGKINGEAKDISLGWGVRKDTIKDNITVISNTITPPQKIEKKNIEEFLQKKCRKRSRPSPEKIIGFAARLEKDKNPQYMLHFAKKMPNHLFIIAGEGSEKEKIESLPPDKEGMRGMYRPKNVILLGHLCENELPAFYQSIDVFCALSEVETFGLSAAEAQSYGVPVLAPRAGALPEVIAEGKTGLLFEPKNLEEATKKLQLLVSDSALWNGMSIAAKQHAQNFNEEKYVERMTTILFKK